MSRYGRLFGQATEVRLHLERRLPGIPTNHHHEALEWIEQRRAAEDALLDEWARLDKAMAATGDA